MILVDDCPYELQPPTQTVRELTRDVCAGNDATGRRIVVAIFKDGAALEDGAELNSLMEARASEINRLELLTQPVNALVRTTLDEALVLLEQAGTSCKEAADLLDAGNGNQGMAMQKLQELVRQWQTIQQSVTLSAEALEIRFEDLNIGGGTFVNLVEGMKSRLTALKEAMDLRDHVMTSDLLRYEFGKTLGDWRTLVESLLKSLPAS